MRQRFDHLPEAAGDDAAVESEAAQGAQGQARARGEFDLVGHVVEHGCRQTRQRRDAAVQRFGEVEFTAHGGLGDLGDGGLRPARAASISITSPWIRVESTSNTMSRFARRDRL